jgi:pyrroline-5-carboxylate reductase
LQICMIGSFYHLFSSLERLILLVSIVCYCGFGCKMSLESQCLGFVGCGKISSAVIRGYASLPAGTRPSRIYVSKRSTDKSQALAVQFPDLITVCENEEVVAQSDIVFIGLLPNVARSELPRLPFQAKHKVISMMAAVDFAEVVSLLPSTIKDVVKTVPLPSAARRSGPILQFPAHEDISRILALVGTPVPCDEEALMKPMVSITGHISSFFELMRTTQEFLMEEGISDEVSRRFVTSFYSSLAQGAELVHEPLAEMRDEAATPGGLNEQSVAFLRNSPHFELQKQSLQAILGRLRGK